MKRGGLGPRWLGLLLLGLLACGSALPEPTASDATRGSRSFAGLTLAELQQGRQLYVARCAGCHVLKLPSELPPAGWPESVAEMRRKNGVRLSDEEAEAIVRYLVVAATPG